MVLGVGGNCFLQGCNSGEASHAPLQGPMPVHTPDLVGVKKEILLLGGNYGEGKMGGIRAERMEALIKTLYMHL